MRSANSFRIRIATSSDCLPLANLRARLWPESSSEEHARELTAILDGTAQRVLRLISFVAEESEGALVGFLEAGLRSCADGCDVSRPVGYVEGWFVEQHRRGQGIGRQLLRAAEAWARAQGCRKHRKRTLTTRARIVRLHRHSSHCPLSKISLTLFRGLQQPPCRRQALLPLSCFFSLWLRAFSLGPLPLWPYNQIFSSLCVLCDSVANLSFLHLNPWRPFIKHGAG